MSVGMSTWPADASQAPAPPRRFPLLPQPAFPRVALPSPWACLFDQGAAAAAATGGRADWVTDYEGSLFPAFELVLQQDVQARAVTR